MHKENTRAYLKAQDFTKKHKCTIFTVLNIALLVNKSHYTISGFVHIFGSKI